MRVAFLATYLDTPHAQGCVFEFNEARTFERFKEAGPATARVKLGV
jgi:hypothetical protein